MGKTTGRSPSKINDYKKYQPYHNASYSVYRVSSGNQQYRVAEHRLAEHRLSEHRLGDHMSAEYSSFDPRSDDNRSADLTSADHKADDRSPANRRSVDRRADDCRGDCRRSSGCRSVDHRADNRISADHRSVDRRSVDHRADNHRSADLRPGYLRSVDHSADDRRSADHRSINRRSVDHRANDSRSANHRSVDHRSDDDRTDDCSSSDKRSTDWESFDRSADPNSFEHRSPKQSINEKFIDFPSSIDLAKCHIMKVLQVAKPYLTQILLYIVKDKKDSDTLESYAMKQRIDFKRLKRYFTEEQISTIRQNPKCDNFDLTLIFSCIEFFKAFNPTMFKIENDDIHSNNSMKDIKDIRNDLCHNRNDLTASQWRDKAKSFKKSLGDLLDMINFLDGKIDTVSEKIRVGEEIDKVMNDGISESDFRYMGLLKVINSNSVAVLNNVTSSICYDKKEYNFKKYFVRKGMTGKTYKNTFYKEEKPILESNSEEVQPDLTLNCKIIEACEAWHPSLKDNENSKKELSNILKQIRGIRNYVIHNMLSMYSIECTVKAQELGSRLRGLVNFIQNKKLDMSMNAAKININKIESDIDFIMSMPYPY